MNHSKIFYLSFNGGELFTIATDSTLTHTIALNEVDDVARSLDWSLGLLVIPLYFMFVAGEAIAFHDPF